MTILDKERWIIRHVVDELLHQTISVNTSCVELSLEIEAETFVISISSDGARLEDEQLAKLANLLNQPRRSDMEEYYGELIGHGTVESSLALLGMMIDKAEIIQKDHATKIQLWRKNK